MASLLDSIENSVGVVLGGAAQATQTALSKATAATSDSLSAILGNNVNKGISVINSINPNNPKPAAPAPTLSSTVIPGISANNSAVLLAAAAAGLILFLVLRK